MKRVLFAFIALSTILIGCSSDSDSKSFESTIKIDGVSFLPKEITAYPLNSSFEKSLIFVLKKNLDTPMDLDEMVFRINYPLTQADASGTYLMTGMQGTGNYTKANNSYLFFNGNIVVEDLGNNKFNISFQNVKGSEGNGSTTVITVTGSISGKFQESN
ncbi:hypothetical protein [Flavobacterium dankookense]|uniref:Lipoprotein n=1 Tax=Flavobacterium dankookense TaxID=706186 RepID=A0A4R6Q7H4_9FLAO|nr:hypothetical protein [Flavobacterium dankookense]TDP57977.1 hypothetical protein BC748_2489 [Flavobacterium dankookense]